MANIGELPYGVLGTAPKFGLQTASQKEIFYGGVHTGCKGKRAGRSKFVVFSFIYWAHCRRRRSLRREETLATQAIAVAFVVAPRIYRCA